MLKKAFICLIVVCCFFVSASPCLAEEANWPLKKSEIENLLDISRKYPLTTAQRDFFYEAISQGDDFARRTGAVMLVKQAILSKQLDYWFKELPWTFSKKFLTTAFEVIKLVYAGDIKEVLKAIEQKTVEQAVKYATDWLLSNEIKIGSGEIDFTFQSFKGGTEQAIFQYLIVYSPQAPQKGQVALEFYSVKPIEPPQGRGGWAGPDSAMDWGSSTCWPWDIWLNKEKGRDNDGKIEPFILRIQSKVEKNQWNDFAWSDSARPSIEVDFQSAVPVLSKDDFTWDREKETKIAFLWEKILKPAITLLQEAGQGSKDALNKVVQALGEIKEGVEKVVEQIKQSLGGAVPEALISQGLNQGDGIASSPEHVLSDSEAAPRNDNGLEPNIITALGELGKAVQELGGRAGEKIEEKVSKISQEAVENPVENFVNSRGPSIAELIEQFDYVSEQVEVIVAQAEELLAKAQRIGDSSPTAQNDSKRTGQNDNGETGQGDEEAEADSQIALAIFEESEEEGDSSPTAQNDTGGADQNDGGGSGQSVNGSSANSGYTSGDPSKIIKPKATEPSYCSTNNLGQASLPAGRAGQQTIILNEIAWMGAANSANDEWIELKNISTSTVNLAGWQILDKDGQIKIILPDYNFPADWFYLLERTDETTAPQITANFIYVGALNNSEEALYLFNSNCELEDMASATSTWPAGDSQTKQTMERVRHVSDPNLWQTSELAGGTPGMENSAGARSDLGQCPNAGLSTSTEPTATSTDNGGETATSTNATSTDGQGDSQNDIVIAQAQLATASSSQDDLIQFFNQTATTVDISGWQIKKKSSTGKEYSVRLLPDNSLAPGKSYFYWLNSAYSLKKPGLASATSSQTLSKNNSLALLNSQKEPIDQLAWGTSTEPFVEGMAFSQNPSESQILQRIWLADLSQYQDTNNNSQDFELAEQGDSSPPAAGQNDGNGGGATSTDTNGQAATSTSATSSQPLPQGLPAITDLTAGPASQREAVVVYWAWPGLEISQYQLTWQALTNATSCQGLADDQTRQTVVLPAQQTVKGEIEHALIEKLSADYAWCFNLKTIDQGGAASTESNWAKAKPWPGFQDNNDGTKTDLLTKTIWPEAIPLTATTTWQEAQDIASQLVMCQDGQFDWPDQGRDSSAMPQNDSKGATSTDQAATSTPQNDVGQELCAGQGGALYDDWRLPSVQELGLLDLAYLPTIPQLTFWTSSNNYYPGQYFGAYPAKTIVQAVDFEQGVIKAVNQQSRTSAFWLLPVRETSGQSANALALPPLRPEENPAFACQEQFIDNEDNTITDQCAGLTWIKGGSRTLLGSKSVIGGGSCPEKTSWPRGLKFCHNLIVCQDGSLTQEKNENPCSNNGGIKYNDWRLPGFVEAFWGLNKNIPGIFPWESGYNYYYWTSALSPGQSQAIGLQKHYEVFNHWFNLDRYLHLQCVRTAE